MKIQEAIKRLQTLANRYPDVEGIHYSRSSLVSIQDMLLRIQPKEP